MTPPTVTNNEQLCFVTIVFPVPDDDTLMQIKNNIDAALENLNKVKVEMRLTSLRDTSLSVKAG